MLAPLIADAVMQLLAILFFLKDVFQSLFPKTQFCLKVTELPGHAARTEKEDTPLVSSSSFVFSSVIVLLLVDILL